MKVLRSTLVAAVAIFAAACGDKVTVAGPTAVTLTSTTTTTPVVPGKVNSVSVAPATATLTVGQQIKMTAAVNADAGIAATVTWTSSDATKASVVDVAGVVTVTAVAATPGVAICATSTVNTSVKGCGSVVVTAVSAVIPATATIAGVFGASITAPLDPTNVTGRVNVQVNISTGTEVVSKVYLMLGTAVVDSQVYTSAQSAALRFAGENADAAKDVSQPTVLLGVNTAAYNTTTGAVSFPNATGQALSVQLFVVGGTAARSTAKYSSNLTLNNTDAVYGSWTLPTTKVQAADAAGYQWTSLGGGTMTLNILPVLFSGKTATSATVKYTNFNNTAKISCASRITAGSTGSCYSATAFGDTASTKTVTTFPGSAIFALYDRDMTRGGADANVITPPVPTISLIYSDNSTSSDASLTALAGTSLALRVDNAAPANVTVAAPLRGSLTKLRSAAAWTARPGSTLTDADSSALITAIGADLGVSNGAVFNADLRGISWKVYTSAGSTSSADTSNVGTTAITAATSLTEGSFYCVRVSSSDKLGNSSLYPDQTIKTAGTIITTTCPTTATGSGLQTRANTLDNTAPVTAFAGIANGDWSSADTATANAFTAGTVNYFYTVAETNAGTDSISVCYYKNVANVMTVTSYISSDAATTTCSKRIAGTGTGTNKAITTATLQLNQITSLGTLAGTSGQIVITSQHYDAAGNSGNKVTRVVLYDTAVPTASAATVPSVLLGDAPAVASFLNDDMSIANYAVDITNNTTLAGSSNVATHVGAYVTSANVGGNNPILRTAYTATTDAASTSPYTKFLNQAVSVTVPAIQYLVRANAAATGSVSEQADALLAAATGYRIHALDQAGNASATSLAFSAPTITNLFNVAALAGAASSPIAGGSGAFTSVALDGAFAYSTDFAAGASAVTGSKVLSSSVRVKVSYYTRHDQTSAFWNNKVSATGWVYCSGRTTAVGGSPVMNGTSAMSESAAIQSVAAPAVDLYLPVRALNATQPTFQYVGTASVLSTTTVTGTPKNNCGDVVTSTYALTVTPTDRTHMPFTSGSALWVVRQSNGFASVLPMGIGYSR